MKIPRLRLLTSLACATLMAATPTPAAPEAGQWWNHPRIIERLALSDAQVEALDELMFASSERTIDLKAALEKAHLKLGRLLEQETLDTAAIEKAVERVVEIRCALFREELLTRAEVAKVLDLEQRNKLRRLHQRLEAQRRADRRRGERPRREPPPRPRR
ncbi:MAG: periplasmic heavy metal sensor [Acidobacteriota bacterium]|nr:periplasmic heavy metal sensor [Acidobacteriota bacterium]MDQ7087587.1 periplasmic heavy metal sensor [Acidobacteriota bacterium]